MSQRGFPFLAAVSAAGLFWAAAPEARAGDEFEDGFKDELGRIAAYEAVGIGRGVLANFLLGGHPGYYEDAPYYPTHRPRYYDVDYDHHPHYRGHGGWNYGHHRPYWRRHHGHGRGHHGHHRPRYHHRHHHHHGCGH